MPVCVGVPREIKPMEGRVALTPSAAGELVALGAKVCLERGAGEPSGFGDSHYQAAGVTLLDSAAEVYAAADVVVKVKEPVDPEIDLLESRHLLFSFLHLAANPVLTQRLCDIGLTAVAFETVAEGRRLPLLQPMSEIAGCIAVQVGATLLHRTQGGQGLLLGGVPGVERGEVVVLGAGHAGGSAARLAAAMGANVRVFDLDGQRLAALQNHAPNISGLYANAAAIRAAAAEADLLIGAVLLPGAQAPRLLSREDVRAMRDGSVLVDIAVDQGGCVETTRPTNYAAPTYEAEGVTHFCVTNMPGAVPRSATQALSGALLPYLKRLLSRDWRKDSALVAAINVDQGKVVLAALLD